MEWHTTQLTPSGAGGSSFARPPGDDCPDTTAGEEWQPTHRLSVSLSVCWLPNLLRAKNTGSTAAAACMEPFHCSPIFLWQLMQSAFFA